MTIFICLPARQDLGVSSAGIDKKLRLQSHI